VAGIDHVDPPAHFPENGITMDRIPLKQMVLPLVVPVIAATIENVTAAGHALPKVALRSPPTPICSASSSARLVDFNQDPVVHTWSYKLDQAA
jgi:hypothetical protein